MGESFGKDASILHLGDQMCILGTTRRRRAALPQPHKPERISAHAFGIDRTALDRYHRPAGPGAGSVPVAEPVVPAGQSQPCRRGPPPRRLGGRAQSPAGLHPPPLPDRGGGVRRSDGGGPGLHPGPAPHRGCAPELHRPRRGPRPRPRATPSPWRPARPRPRPSRARRLCPSKGTSRPTASWCGTAGSTWPPARQAAAAAPCCAGGRQRPDDGAGRGGGHHLLCL